MASGDWNIIYYESSSGDIPVYYFIESLGSIAKSKVSNTFDLLTEYGIKLGLPHVKKEIKIALARLKDYKKRNS